jgi:hypothetical protein
MLQKLIKAMQMERQMNLRSSEEERNRLLSSLSKNLTDSDIRLLMAQSNRLRSHQISAADYIETLEKLCARKEISLSRYPNFVAGLHYRLLVESIDQNLLPDELKAQIARVVKKLATTDEQKLLIQKSHEIQLLRKLAMHSLTHDEWAEIQMIQGWEKDSEIEEHSNPNFSLFLIKC